MSHQYGHSLLLRLFTSEHFNLPVALTYLKQYPDSIGITYYLVHRLRAFSHEEIEFYWPQLCHLLVSRPSESVALENFILQKCTESTHLAMLSMWYLQASMTDLANQPKSQAFATCRRAFNRVQSIIFSDLAEPLAPQSATAATLGIQEAERILPHLLPALTGLGLVAASVGVPILSKQLGTVALQQGRRKLSEFDANLLNQSAESSEDEEERIVESPSLKPPTNLKSMSGSIKRKSAVPPLKRNNTHTLNAAHSPPLSRSATFSKSSEAKSPSRVKAVPNSPLINASSKRIASSRHSSSAFRPSPVLPYAGNVAASTSRLIVTPAASASVPSLPLRHDSSSALSLSNSSHGTSLIDIQKAAALIPRPQLIKSLRAHACRAQLDLLNSLQDISTRLVSVPKMARVSALRAELTVLNHGLPRGCCLCIDCDGPVASTASTSSNEALPHAPKGHHRIIRISPSEAVVLNSADRAPFLIQVEVLEGDLDFDPGRRQNMEDVRAVLNDREMALAKKSYQSATTSSSSHGKHETPINGLLSTPDVDRSSSGFVKEQGSPALEAEETEDITNLAQAKESKSIKEAETPIEEMDMVEQLYGDMSNNAIPDTDAFTPQIHNRSVDEEAWQRKHAHRTSVTASVRPSKRRDALTIDEYAERMRMAAIMLSQLAANEQTPMSMVQATSGAAGGLVGVGMGITYGIGGVVGASLGAVRDRFYGNEGKAQGQASAGLSAKLNTSTAVSGISEVQGTPSGLPNMGFTNGQIPMPQASAPRAKVLLPGEAAAIKERIMSEMVALEDERMARMQADSKARSSGWTINGAPTPQAVQDQSLVMSVVNKEDPSGASMAESWTEKRSRIRASSPYGHLANWNVTSVIVKTGADLRQEQLATQLIREFGRIWAEAKCPHWIKYFRILVTSESTGLIETIVDTLSVHSIKKAAYAKAAAISAETPLQSYTLYDHFVEKFGSPDTSTYRRAQTAFMKSLASYSIICYLLQIKDRHNGNILIDKTGHIIHIDFGFLLSNSPGQLGFEMAPFKITQDYIDILGGFESEHFAEFRALLRRTFWDARSQADRIVMIVELMQKDSKLPCFSVGEQTAFQLKERFQLGLTRRQCDDFVDRLLDSSSLNSFTKLYDAFQTFSQGIL